MKKPRERFRGWLALSFALLVSLLLGWLHARPRPAAEATGEVVPVAPESPKSPVSKRRTKSHSTPPQRDPSCTPGAFQRCYQGDVWSEDSCGQVEELLDECGVQLCREGTCDEPDETPCTEPIEGRCDGAVVRLCQAGRALSIDCAVQGLRCHQGEEGAECAPAIPREERCSGGPRCEGQVLVRCLGGQRARLDCALEGATCGAKPGAELGCVKLLPALPEKAECGACGCPPSALGERACDGRDEDGDQRVDEGLDCGPVPIVAFVIADAAGYSSYSRDEIEAELSQANRLLADEAEDSGLHLELADMVVLREPSWLDLSAAEIQRAADDPRLHPARPAFYVPVVFTDVLSTEGSVPRVGASTLPNGFCGGIQRGHGPKLGLVGIGKARAATTFLHELGHFLGLCHTHEQATRASVAAASNGTLQACEPACVSDGDGICDTPFDPGPEECGYDASCNTLCSHGARPDAQNLMSYYTLCRRHFSRDQTRILQHTLALRRAWHACLTSDCACELGAGDCPVGMSCRPHATDLKQASCVLSGNRAPGASCEAHSQCGDGSLCLGDAAGVAHCARPCSEPSVACACVPTSLGFKVCREDLEQVPR